MLSNYLPPRIWKLHANIFQQCEQFLERASDTVSTFIKRREKRCKFLDTDNWVAFNYHFIFEATRIIDLRVSRSYPLWKLVHSFNLLSIEEGRWAYCVVPIKDNCFGWFIWVTSHIKFLTDFPWFPLIQFYVEWYFINFSQTIRRKWVYKEIKDEEEVSTWCVVKCQIRRNCTR